MKWRATLKNLHKGSLFAWGSIALGMALTILYRDKPADLRVELMSKARVYDVHADVPGLSISYAGVPIRENGEVLSFFSIRFSNVGGGPLTQNLYDGDMPFGFALTGGRVIAPEVVEASQVYLKQTLRPRVVEDRTVVIEKVLIDAGASFVIRTLVLHSDKVVPEVMTLGKVVGMDIGSIGAPEPPLKMQPYAQSFFLIAAFCVGLGGGIIILGAYAGGGRVLDGLAAIIAERFEDPHLSNYFLAGEGESQSIARIHEAVRQVKRDEDYVLGESKILKVLHTTETHWHEIEVWVSRSKSCETPSVWEFHFNKKTGTLNCVTIEEAHPPDPTKPQQVIELGNGLRLVPIVMQEYTGPLE